MDKLRSELGFNDSQAGVFIGVHPSNYSRWTPDNPQPLYIARSIEQHLKLPIAKLRKMMAERKEYYDKGKPHTLGCSPHAFQSVTGLTSPQAAAVIGVDRSNWHRWLAGGRTPTYIRYSIEAHIIVWRQQQ